MSFAQQVDAAKADVLYKAGKMLEAMPMYEELAEQHPNDVVYQVHLAMCRNAEAEQTDDPAASKKLMIRAQEAARPAVELGETSHVIQDMAKRDLNALDCDNPAWTLLHEAEKSFSAGDFPAALAKYAQAADYNPQLYEAPLYAGDAAFRQKDMATAIRWYGRAVAINPKRETAYRYWGDANLSAAMGEDPGSSRSLLLYAAARAKVPGFYCGRTL
jgi:tetratricopeptide (TPR) repeat protein